MTRTAKTAILVCTVALLVAACGRSDPKTLLLGEWKEDMKTEKWEKIRASYKALALRLAQQNLNPYPDGIIPVAKESTIHFFPDGTAVKKMVYDNPRENSTDTFTWSLSEDGKILKTEAKGAVGVHTAHIALLTKKELRIDEGSSANGHFERIE